ncbi:MAG: hypothetical protein WAV90_00850 [Gordonia amarae]
MGDGVDNAPAPGAHARVPDGFFNEVAAVLRDETAEAVADAVLQVCTQRGILHPELEQEPGSELRAEEIREVFELVGAVSYAVADGRVIPADVREEFFDENMLTLWEGFITDATDDEAAAEAQALSAGTAP